MRHERLLPGVAAGGLIAILAVFWLPCGELRAAELDFRRGDTNGDGRLDISDGIATLNYLFTGQFTAQCLDAADSDDSGTVVLTDAVFTFSFLFTGGPPPPPPGHLQCGPDPTPDALSCDRSDLCAQDTRPPVISSLRVENISSDSATVTWTTDEPADSRVEYGTTTRYGSVRSSSALVTAHSLQLGGLSPGTTYNYMVTSRDAAGNAASSANATFLTIPADTDLKQIGHLLNRVAYGPSPADIDRVEAIGIRNYIEEQLNPETIDESSNTALRSREAALFDTVPLSRDARLIAATSLWRYFKGTEAPPANWAANDFDDATWLRGLTGIGYGDNDDNTILTDMQGNYLSVFCRKQFQVPDPAALSTLILRVIYDDGFAAYLNGTRVATRNLSAFNHNSAASSSIEPTLVEIDLSSFKNRLVAGTNTLAIQIHNASLTSSDLSLIPELIDRVLLPGEPISTIKGIDELQQLIHVRGVYSRRQLQTVLAEFWDNHLTTDYDKVAEYFDELRNSDATDAMSTAQARAEAAHAEFLEYQFFYDNALGNFGDLLLYSATSPTQLIYLDNVLNVKAAPNENYAREILELYAFGVDNRYVQRDIEQLSKCFTGWTVCKVPRDEAPSFPASARNPPIDCGVKFTDTNIVNIGSGWRYLKGTAEPTPDAGGGPTSAWTALGFDDGAWTSGSTGIGYGDGDDATVLNDMRNNYVSVYLRRRFQVANPSAFKNLILEVRYDDGFVAYLNGVEIGRANMSGTPPAYNRVASESHEVTDAAAYFNLNGFIDLLQPGTNVLAIQVHNVSIDSSDLSMLPRLIDREILPGSIEHGDPSGVWTFRFDPDQHDTSAKTLFQGTPYQINIPAGRTGAAGLQDALQVIDAMVSHPSTAEFICIKLIQRFVSDEISLATFKAGTAPAPLRALLADAVAAWNSTTPRGNVETVMHVILDPVERSNLFWSDVAYRSKVKTPIEFINSSLRILDAAASGANLPSFNARMGMEFFTRDDPDGWSESGLDWIDTATMLQRMEFARSLANNQGSASFRWTPLPFLDSRGLDTAEEIVDYFSDLLFQGALPQANKELLLEFLTTDDNGAPSPLSANFQARVQELLGLMLSMPQWNFQ